MARSVKLEEIFSQDGLLARVLRPDYEWRPQQGEMADAVYRTLQDGGALLVEAPTGVGKSLAYLVPGILWSLGARQPFLVSTYTRSLQDQILDKDLPIIRRLIERDFRVVVLKGRGNYLCRNRWMHYLEDMRGTSEGEDLERALGYWTQTTETGDFSEIPLMSGKTAAKIAATLPRISSETRFCSGPACRPESGCFFKASRIRARDAHLIIVNHSLLLIDLLTGAAGIPDWNGAVIDEGHHLPRAAAEPLSFSVSESALEGVLKSLGGRGEPGLTDQLRKVVRGHPGKAERAEILARLRELEAETGRLSLLARSFWADMKAAPDFPVGEERRRYGPTAPVRGEFPASGFDLCNQFEQQLQGLGGEIEGLRRLRRDATEVELWPLAEAEQQWDEAREELRKLEELLTPDKEGFIYWVEPATAAGVALKAAPLEVGPQLREVLFRRKNTIVTSATLALGGRFEHIAHKLGLDEGEYEALLLPTPFQLQRQVSAVVVTGTPDPNDREFPASLAQGVEMLTRGLRRKTLVLFTSHEALRRVESVLRAPLEERGIRLLAQGLDGGQRQVKAGFQEVGPAVLLGTASFWEGVDFPGEELEILIMARLPFMVPTDPLVEAMGERMQAEGLDPFRHYQLPEALIRFRQGFGRLIRRLGDRGLFVVVDPRLQSRAYGARFKESVGVPFRSAAGWEDLVRLAEEWFAASETAPDPSSNEPSPDKPFPRDPSA